MTPFTGNGINTGDHLLLNGYTASSTGANNNPEDHRRTGRSTVCGFRYSQTVGIIIYTNFLTKPLLQIIFKRFAYQPDGLKK